MDKRVLLIAGGGTLGTYVAKELLALGCSVEVICPEDKVSDHERLSFHQCYATDTFLTELLTQNHYDGIVNFLHYTDAEDYKRIYPSLIKGTDHLIYLSSYRVYGNEQHPITEEAPQLYDTVSDRTFLENEDYAVPKSMCEKFLVNECKGDHWTIVRPVISFSSRRLDLLLYSGHRILQAAERGEELLMPDSAKDLKAGLDWAGNSGKLIAHLLFKPDAMGEAFTIYSGQDLTWEEIAQAYSALTGVKIRWCSQDEYIHNTPRIEKNPWIWKYDRIFNRDINCSKVLKVTGLTPKDFSSIYEGIKKELEIIGWQPQNYT